MQHVVCNSATVENDFASSMEKLEKVGLNFNFASFAIHHPHHSRYGRFYSRVSFVNNKKKKRLIQDHLLDTLVPWRTFLHVKKFTKTVCKNICRSCSRNKRWCIMMLLYTCSKTWCTRNKTNVAHLARLKRNITCRPTVFTSEVRWEILHTKANECHIRENQSNVDILTWLGYITAR